jgi:hypothetical protein
MGVEEDDEQHGDGTETLDVGPVPGAGGSSDRGGSRLRHGHDRTLIDVEARFNSWNDGASWWADQSTVNDDARSTRLRPSSLAR